MTTSDGFTVGQGLYIIRSACPTSFFGRGRVMTLLTLLTRGHFQSRKQNNEMEMVQKTSDIRTLRPEHGENKKKTKGC